MHVTIDSQAAGHSDLDDRRTSNSVSLVWRASARSVARSASCSAAAVRRRSASCAAREATT
eukprot:COSAG01_NODE_525_length_15926_cov_28.158021_11_plen_61_part_00